MEIAQQIWSALTTENEILTKYVCLSLTFIEIYVTMKLFTTILNISYTKKQRNIYFICMSIITIFSTLFLPSFLNLIVGFIAIPILIKYIFNTSLIKSILARILPTVFIIIFESLYLKLCLKLFNISTEQCSNTLLYRLIFMISIYLSIYLLTKLIISIKKNHNIFENLDLCHKKILLLNLFFILIVLSVQFYLLMFYNNVLPLYITFISLLSLIAYCIVSIYSIIKTINLEITETNLTESKLYNKTLEILYNNTRAFKHDFSNIITAIGGYVYTKDINGLEHYYSKILNECKIDNNLSTLNPTTINNPAIYNILASKYYKADELGININLEIFINLNELKMNIYEFTRILGILLDNAIEATNQCNEKLINIDIREAANKKYQILTIENTYLNKNLDINQLGKKGYTTKTENAEAHGIDLWQVSKMLKKLDYVLLETSKNEKFFKQELIIYYKQN